MSKKRIHNRPKPPSVRDLETFLADAAGFRVTEEAAIDKAFLAFAQQRGEDLYSDVYIQRWKAEHPGEDFPLAYQLLEQCGVPYDKTCEVTFLELICFLYDNHPKITDLAGAKTHLYRLRPYHTAFVCLDSLAHNCCFSRKGKE